jgi:mono/diheme cytochrome c family protein
MKSQPARQSNPFQQKVSRKTEPDRPLSLAKKPALFLEDGCYVSRPMSRLASLLSAVLAIAAIHVRAQIAPPPEPKAAPPVATPSPAATADPNALKFDAESKTYNAKQGESSAAFTFTVTNVSAREVVINRLSTSCGCTVAQLPTTPYHLGSGSNVSLSASMDLRGKFGTITKSISVDSSAGFKSLTVSANIPQAAPVATAAHGTAAQNAMGDRAKNIQSALADRQAIFKGECRTCHVDKGVGKMGQELYAASCGICHEAEHRAAMVTDLKVPRTERDLAFWQKWIMEGKPGTLMPAFAQAHGGPLTQEQIDSLTVYLYQTMPRSPKVVATAPKPASAPLPLPPQIVPPAVQKN